MGFNTDKTIIIMRTARIAAANVNSVADAFTKQFHFIVTGYQHDAESEALNWFKAHRNTFDIWITLVVTEGTDRVYAAGQSDSMEPILWVVLKEPEIVAVPAVEVKDATVYHVTHEGTTGVYAPEGYKQYNRRFEMDYRGQLPAGEQVYGYAQAIDHIRQLKREGARPPGTKFYVVITKSTTIKIPVT